MDKYMNGFQKAEEIKIQGGRCKGVRCDGRSNVSQCPVYEICDREGQNLDEKLRRCNEILEIVDTPKGKPEEETLLDRFAMVALEGLLKESKQTFSEGSARFYSSWAYDYAEAMMAEKRKREAGE